MTIGAPCARCKIGSVGAIAHSPLVQYNIWGAPAKGNASDCVLMGGRPIASVAPKGGPGGQGQANTEV